MEAILSTAVSTCPFLAKTSVSTLRQLATKSVVSSATPTPTNPSLLFRQAQKCPVMGQAISTRAFSTTTGCPHSKSFTVNAAAVATDSAHHHQASLNHHHQPPPPPPAAASSSLAATKHARMQQHQAQKQSVTTATKPFNYEDFYQQELDKKHADKSYRYFNNINRLARQFPAAHTGTGELVTVWCSNDYLGMSKNPVVVDSMK